MVAARDGASTRHSAGNKDRSFFPNGPWFLPEVLTLRSVATAVAEVFSGKDER